jgi:hypothetical protein
MDSSVEGDAVVLQDVMSNNSTRNRAKGKNLRLFRKFNSSQGQLSLLTAVSRQKDEPAFSL